MASARRKGKAHGRQGLPSPNWGARPVPFLEGLHAKYQREIENLEQRLRVIEGQSLSTRDGDVANRVAVRTEIRDLESQIKGLQATYEELLREKHGREVENPVGRAARSRHISLPLYLGALFALAVGEFLVTVPAVKLVLGDSGWQAYILTLSFAALSIAFAHILGMTMKLQVDRKDPQPTWQLRSMAFLTFGLCLVVLQLSALRSGNVDSIPFSFGLGTAVFGTALFFFVQTSFIACAVALAYYNHSDIESRLHSTKKELKRARKTLAAKTRTLAAPPAGHITPEKILVQLRALLSSMNVIETQYRQIAAEYRGANLLAQKDAMASEKVGLDEPALVIPRERFEKAMTVSESRIDRGDTFADHANSAVIDLGKPNRTHDFSIKGSGE